MENDLIKVFFVQKVGKEYKTESLWCKRDGDRFIIDNIPFVAKRVSLGDIILAEFDEDEQVYYFDSFVGISGNTTLHLEFTDSSLIEKTRVDLINFGCESEVLPQLKLIAVNVPKEVAYKPIKEFLDYGESNNFWVYEESCLAHLE